MKKPPLRALDGMNAFCCLFVILIHVLSIGISQGAPTSWQMILIYFPWRIVSFVVPAFLFTGAVKLGRGGGADSYSHYILSRIRAVYLPYLLWTVIYFVAFIPIGYVRGTLPELLFYLRSASIASPFYYITIVMQFYLLRPVWLWMLKKIPWFVAIVGAIPITFFISQCTPLLAQFNIEFRYVSSLAGSYLLFWVLGLYVGQHYELVEDSLHQHKQAVFSLSPLVLLMAFVPYMQFRTATYVYALDYFKFFVDCMAIAILLLVCILINRHLPKLQAILQWIHRGSFFVYLSHCLFLTYVTHWAGQHGITNLSTLIVLRAVTCYTVPFILYWLWSKLKQATSK